MSDERAGATLVVADSLLPTEADEAPELPVPSGRYGQVGGGRFVLVDLLGEGGMAAVHRAWDRKERAWRAVKLLSPAFVARPAIRARFEREARVLATLRHPHVVGVHAAGLEEVLPWLALDLVDGRSLADSVHHGGPMPVALAVQVALDVCAGVHAAHQAGVVHRDLKPGNVLVGSDGRCRVADFGIARLLDEELRLTRTGRMMGSPGFMAPEQLVDAKQADARSDVWAIAVTLAVCIAGGHPGELDELLEHVAQRVPRELSLALVRATTSEPRYRTATVERLAAALERCRDQLPERSAPYRLHLPLPPLPPSSAPPSTGPG